MDLVNTKTPSPSLRYVAMCNSSDFKSYYFRRFCLPETEENTVNHAAWYFLNRLNFTACLEAVIAAENFVG